MDDLLSRQAAIDAMGKAKWAKERLEELPSAQPEYTEQDMRGEFSAGYDCGMEAARHDRRWIPCSERLPEVGQSVLLSVGGMYTAEGCLRDDGDWTQFRWDAIQRKDMVGAWKPLDEPWRGEGQ